MGRLLGFFGASVLVVAACGRSSLDSEIYEQGVGGASAGSSSGGRGGSGSTVAGGMPTAGSFVTAGSFGTGGTFGVAGSFGTGGKAFGGTGGGPSAGAGGTPGLGESEPPPPGKGAVQLDAGRRHACAVLEGGALVCWGYGADGALGYGNTENIGDDELPVSAGFVEVSSDPSLEVVQVVTGAAHTCALLSNASVQCWGSNAYGQLGYPNEPDDIGSSRLPSQLPPVDVHDADGQSVVELAAGFAHTCARLSDGSVWCWGASDFGQLGHGSSEAIGDDEPPSTAGPVRLAADPAVTATQIAAGARHTCAVLSDGGVKCWGVNSHGELGLGSTEHLASPALVGPIELGVAAGEQVAQVVAGVEHTCVLLTDHSVKCWGADFQLGYPERDEDLGDDELPSAAGAVSIVVDGMPDVTQLSAGDHHTCARLSDGSAKCWGSSSVGQLGYGNAFWIGDDEAPSAAGSVSVTASNASVVVVEAGGSHTCALLSNGAVKCWGYGGDGALGTGATLSVGDNELPSQGDFVRLY